MKILVDTNILISAVLFPRSKPAKALVYIAENHEMVLCDQNLTDFTSLRSNLIRKFSYGYLPLERPMFFGWQVKQVV